MRHGHPRVDAGGADVAVIFRLHDGHAQLFRLLDGPERALVHREVPEAAVAVHHDARRPLLKHLHGGVHVQVTVAHHRRIAADLPGAVAEDASEIIARQQLSQEGGPVGNQPRCPRHGRHEVLHVPMRDAHECLRRQVQLVDGLGHRRLLLYLSRLRRGHIGA